MVMHSGDPPPRAGSVRSLLKSDDDVEALQALAVAIRQRPHDVSLRVLASDACERLGALPEAAAHLSAILLIEPDQAAANRRLAGLLYELGDMRGAIRCWRRLLATVQEEDSESSMLLAVALCTDGQYDEAVELLTRLAQTRSTDAITLANLGMALLAAGHEEKAFEALTRAVTLDPQSAQAHCGLGLRHYNRERWQDAAACFRATERFAPDSAIGSYNLGLALERLGERDEARRALLRAAALEPHDDEIQRALEPLLARHSSIPAGVGGQDVGASMRGELQSFDLLNVLEFLRMQEKTGLLVTSAPAGVGMLRLEQGMLIGGSAPGSKRIGEELLQRGLISREKLLFALARQRELHPSAQDALEPDSNALATVLLREQLVEERQLARTLFRMILQVIGQINQWREGVFAFYPSADTAFPIRFNVQEVVLDLMRLEDERRQRTEPTG
jgi:Flp pilus assembly protein TadD